MNETLYRVCPDCHNWKSHVSMCKRCDGHGFLDATAEVTALRAELAAAQAELDAAVKLLGECYHALLTHSPTYHQSLIIKVIAARSRLTKAKE